MNNNFKPIDFLIVSEINKSLALLGGKSDILGTVASWKDTLTDDEVLSHLKNWNEWKVSDLKECLELGS